jgi:hypothetical protein
MIVQSPHPPLQLCKTYLLYEYNQQPSPIRYEKRYDCPLTSHNTQFLTLIR